MQTSEFFDISGFAHSALFEGVENVWDALARIGDYITNTARHNVPEVGADGVRVAVTTVVHEGEFLTDNLEITHEAATKGKLTIKRKGKELPGASVIFEDAILAGTPIQIGRGTVIESGAYLGRRTLIGDRCEVRQGAYVRGNCVTGTGCVIGHATEVKNSIFLDNAKAGHFAYVGDSILGAGVNLGAGTKLANLKIVRGNIVINVNNKKVDTGVRKLGALLGDGCETGCNSVTSPGTLLGPGSMLYPNTSAPSGYYAPQTVISPAKDAVVVRTRHRR